MTEAKVVLTAVDNASRVIDNVTRRLGIFNREGIAMGISFALVNKAIELTMQGFQRLIDEFIKGVARAMDFELNLVRVTNTIRDMDITVGELSKGIHDLSETFGVDINKLAVDMKMLTREGYSASESMRILSQAQLFSTATGEDLTSIIDVLNTTMGVFDLSSSNSGYILNKLNTIINTTGLSMQQISDIFGRASPEIRKAGYDLNDVVNILYTLAKQEVGPRSLGPELDKWLKDIGYQKIMEVPAGSVKSVEDMAAGAVETHKKAVDVIGASWDNMWEGIGQGALDTLDFLNQKWSWDKGWYTDKQVLPGLGDTSLQIDWMDEYIRKQKALGLAIESNKLKIDEYTIYFAGYNQDLIRNKAQYYFTIDMRNATLAVQEQEDAIEKLRRISNAYSLEQSINNLEIMRIQYGAMGSRRGIGRGQQRQIDAIEKENMLLRIKESEQQIKIGQIQQTGLQTAQDSLDKIRRAHDQVIYQQELIDLSKHIDDVHTLWLDMYKTLAQEKAALLNNQNLAVSLTTSNVTGSAAPSSSSLISQLIARGMSRKTIDILGNPFSRVR